jgi:hypothetical protein
MVTLRRSLSFISTFLVGTFLVSHAALASSILLGSDYLTTVADTFFDFPGIGPVPLEGRPIGPGNTDTIVQRQADAILPALGSSDMIPIEMVALSLQSTRPVNIDGSFFDVFVHLTPGTNSTGEMTINHEFADNGTPAPEGTFTSFFDIFFTVELTPTGGGAPVSQNFVSRLVSDPAFWSHEPDAGPPAPVIITGLPGDQTANLHSPVPASFDDFFIVGVVEERHQAFPGLHRARQATVPEPSTLLLMGFGLLVLARLGRKGLYRDVQMFDSETVKSMLSWGIRIK